MGFVRLSKEDGIAIVVLDRGKVNALNEPFVEEINRCFADLENDGNVKAIILTGQGKFFSFGFDVPEFMDYEKGDFLRYVDKFTSFYAHLFLFPKPIVAALNGHTIAGGCMLATACDHRIMVSGKAKISLNEITFGSSVFVGSVEMLKYCVGQRNAESILYSGTMYSAEEAMKLGLVDQISTEDNLTKDAGSIAREFANKDRSAFTSIKRLLRKPVAESIKQREKQSIIDFAEIWYSESTWNMLQQIKIHQ